MVDVCVVHAGHGVPASNVPSATTLAPGVHVGVGDAVPVGVAVGVAVGVLVGVAVGVFVGVGVNVNARAEDFPEELRGEATSVLLERGEPAPRALFAAACLSELEGWIDRHAEEGFGPVRDAWRKRSVTLGREVTASVQGREVVGTAEDIDDSGALLVRGRGGVERITAGDIVHLRPR